MSSWKQHKDAGNAAYQQGNSQKAIEEYGLALQEVDVPTADRATPRAPGNAADTWAAAELRT